MLGSHAVFSEFQIAGPQWTMGLAILGGMIWPREVGGLKPTELL